MEFAQHIDSLCKPPGSLGDLEAIALRLCEIQGTHKPDVSVRRAVIFAADHGVVSEGVSAWPSEVTALVVALMQTQRTASGVFAAALGCRYEVVDIGLLHPLASGAENESFIQAARRRGTGNLRLEAAMNADDFEHAWAIGVERANAAAQAGCKLVIGGEMGIGNTTAASCLVGWFCEMGAQAVVGRGAGIDDDGLQRKRLVVDEALARVRAIDRSEIKRIACEIGGLEITALAGFYARSVELGMVVVLDGFIAGAAALLAEALRPNTRRGLIAGHRSVEVGHAIALERLGLQPLLDLNMRLGEGTGALAALAIIDLAAAMVNRMATLEELQNS